MAGTLLDFAISSALEPRHRWSPDVSVSALRKRKNGAWGFIRVDIKRKPGTLVFSG
jgi:NADH:ubiquinone oxidoreductase subunit 4 (subunit M)